MSAIQVAKVVLPWAAAWHLYYWLVRFLLTALIPDFAEPSLKTIKEFSEVLRLDTKMPSEEKARRVGVYVRNYWATCVLSFTNGVAMVAILVPFIWQNPGVAWSGDTETTYESVWIACHIFMGYMLNDLACVIKPVLMYRLSDEILFIGHHGAILVVWSSFCYDDWGHLFAIPTMMTEVTALFINFRVLLVHQGLDSDALYTANGALALVSWYYLRLWKYCTVLSIRLFELRACFYGEHGVRNSFVLLIFLFGFAIQCYWGYILTNGAIQAVVGGGGSGAGASSKEAKAQVEQARDDMVEASLRRSTRQRRRQQQPAAE